MKQLSYTTLANIYDMLVTDINKHKRSADLFQLENARLQDLENDLTIIKKQISEYYKRLKVIEK